jgi:peptidoglycan/xylan/chitin deacetylase (PgdA/CDA1 family)
MGVDMAQRASLPHESQAAMRASGFLRLATIVVVVLTACSAPATAPATPSPTEPAALSPAPSTTKPSATQTSLAPTASPTATPTPTSRATPTVRPTAAPVATMHIVLAGETLSLIAAMYATTWQSVVYWNRDAYPTLDPMSPSYDPNSIRVGWRLEVWPGIVVPFDAPLPTRPPTPKPTIAPTAPPAAAPSTLVTNGSRSSGMVALTFDMGGRTDPAVAIMRWLRDNGVRATIFMTGSAIDTTTAAREVMSIINANGDQFDLGNHSYAHPDMTTMSASAVTAELRRAEDAIGRYATQPTRPLFRPPYGAWDTEMLAGVGAAGYRWSVMWDVDTIDWKPIADGGPTAPQIVDKVIGRAQGGSIVLMHLGGYETLNALPGVLSGLRARGLTPVTLETLLGS